MSNNNFNSGSDYTIISVTSTNTNTNIIKRPYSKTLYSSNKNKKKNNSDSFKEKLDSLNFHKDSDNDSNNFSNLLMDELTNAAKLKNSENSIVTKPNFENKSENALIENSDTLNKSVSEQESNATSLDTSELYRKIELLNSLRNP